MFFIWPDLIKVSGFAYASSLEYDGHDVEISF
ncbi:hypothetical protein FWK35_00024874 [Aphis craccivora]|uniref:Uncharacterized protein n=1 Tax=Aphis craccivora TaxID=307492 RepID=A0A6G0YES6_APHCR|nr:hypothetical protein FWK35_00024874 [Aphis craccivora]